MSNLPSWVSKVQSIWFAIAAFLIVLVNQGVGIPNFLTGIFSEAVFDGAVTAASAVIAFYQILRANFAAKEPAGEVKVLSAGAKRAYMLNPFKLVA